MPFKRNCIVCGKKFQPTGRYCKFCEKCKFVARYIIPRRRLLNPHKGKKIL